ARIVEHSIPGTIVETEAGLRLCCATNGEAAAPNGQDIAVLLRPERVQVHMPSNGAGSGPNRFAARIAEVTYLGEDLHLGLALDCGQKLRAALKNANSSRGFAAMQAVEVVVDPGDIRILSR